MLYTRWGVFRGSPPNPGGFFAKWHAGARAFFDKTPWGVFFQRWTRWKKAKAKQRRLSF